MAQRKLEAGRYTAEIDFYISPVGHWRIDLTTSQDWSKKVTTPLLSGDPGRWLTEKEVNQLREVAFGIVERGIHVIADPT